MFCVGWVGQLHGGIFLLFIPGRLENTQTLVALGKLIWLSFPYIWICQICVLTLMLGKSNMTPAELNEP